MPDSPYGMWTEAELLKNIRVRVDGAKGPWVAIFQCLIPCLECLLDHGKMIKQAVDNS